MADDTPAVDPGLLVTSRPLDEYCGLFGLTRARLAAVPGPVLDCPGGAAGLPAEARALGCHVIAADPAYALPPPEVAAHALAARAAMAAAMAARPELYPPARLRPYDRYLRSWDRARRLYTADSAAHPEQYVAAALPRLPFADGAFALTLSGYLLFAYPERFGPRRQLDALVELVRVTAPDGEVRVYPLHDGHGRPCGRLDALRYALGERRIASEIRRFPRAEDGRTRRVLVLCAADHRRRAAGNSQQAGGCI
ncbi:phage tail protein [Kitasatospora aureofaciens]|uniref:phage tail protein n=1 Tax=Kitasatospora aureofaciens TaxID=1894 RepID=UPI001C472D58|nr:phage tail protein [Kitasatospora aureofaciens]MBV6701426.1 phage tail protein [Kitasatospora aureofaciens]